MSVRDALVDMGAEQGGRKMTIREDGKTKVCANFIGGEWVPTSEFEVRLGRKSPEERVEEAKEQTAEKREAATETGSGTKESKKGGAAEAIAAAVVAEDELTESAE